MKVVFTDQEIKEVRLPKKEQVALNMYCLNMRACHLFGSNIFGIMIFENSYA